MAIGEGVHHGWPGWGVALVTALTLLVVGLYQTSPPDMIDAFLLIAPPPTGSLLRLTL